MHQDSTPVAFARIVQEVTSVSQAEVTGEPGEHGDGPAPLAPEDGLDLRTHPWSGGIISGRISMQPNLAAGMVAAHRNASSRSAQSST